MGLSENVEKGLKFHYGKHWQTEKVNLHHVTKGAYHLSELIKPVQL